MKNIDGRIAAAATPKAATLPLPMRLSLKERATTIPNPRRASAVRTQARKVRSAAR